MKINKQTYFLMLIIIFIIMPTSLFIFVENKNIKKANLELLNNCNPNISNIEKEISTGKVCSYSIDEVECYSVNF